MKIRNTLFAPTLVLLFSLCMTFAGLAGCTGGKDSGAGSGEAGKPEAQAPSESGEKAAEAKPEGVSEDSKKLARESLDQAIKLIESDDKADLEAGKQAAQQAIDLDPDFARPYCAMGTAERKLGNLDAALTWYKQAVAKDPEYVVCFDNMGYAYYELGRIALENADASAAQTAFAQAEESFNQAIKLDDTYADAHFNLGQLHQTAHANKQEALKEFTRFVELSSDEYKKEEVKALMRQLQ